ncbi:MAG: Bug family tripartite tricarboxylate transporter substrate binding protein [Beijerinckiaceae bacterium]
MDRRQFLGGAAAGALALGGAGSAAFAQATDWPNGPLRIFIGFPAGSGADILGRYFTNKIAEHAGKPVIVENKPGANSNIAAGLVANAKPDGNSILFIASSNMAANPFLFKSMPFDTVKDFRAAGTFAQIVFVLVVKPDSPFNTIDDLVKHLKSKKQNKYGYTNQTAIMSTELFKTMTGTEAVGVSYRTAPDAMPDVTNGTLDYMIMDGTFAAGQIRAGRLKPLAITTAERSPSFPGVPTMQEAGLKGYDFAPWWGVYFPKGTPDAIVAKMEGWLQKIGADPETPKFLETVGAIVNKDTAKQADERLIKEIARMGPIIKAAGIEPQ